MLRRGLRYCGSTGLTRLCGSSLGAGPAGCQRGPPRHAPRHARRTGPTASSVCPVSKKTPAACPSYLGPTGRERPEDTEPQRGLQHGAGQRSRKRLSTRVGRAEKGEASTAELQTERASPQVAAGLSLRGVPPDRRFRKGAACVRSTRVPRHRGVR